LRFLTFKPRREVEKDFYAEVPVELKIRGKFHNLVSFFDRISRLPRIVTISNLNIIESKKSSGSQTDSGTFIEATCNAITFRFIEARIDDPAEDDKKKGKKGRRR
jgi:type IV pilus assembly protein PilO